MRLENKTIILTGGTSGIGYQMTKILHARNNLHVIARQGDKLDKLKTEFPSVTIWPADLSKPTQFETLADNITCACPHIDLLINNAAVQNTPTYLDKDFDYQTIEPEIHLNLTSVCALSYLLLPALMNKTTPSAIVNINSGLGLAPKTNSAVYCATKAGVDTFSQGLSYQLTNTNVQVLQAFLPLVDTPMTQGRGGGKISAIEAAQQILGGIERRKALNDIGKVKLLRFLLWLMPSVARSIMKKL